MPKSELAQRVAVAAIGIPVAVAVVHLGGWVLGVVLALISIGGSLELFRIAEHSGVRPLKVAGAAAAALFVLVAASRQTAAAAAPWFVVLTLVVVLGVAGASIWTRGVEGRPLIAVSVTVLGAVFTGWTLSHALFLRHALDDGQAVSVIGPPTVLATQAWAGTALVVFAIGLTWVNDTCAYFAGRTWGRRKLIPKVSPGKTVVGAVAGVVGSVVAGALYAHIVLDGWYGLPLGALSGGFGGALIAVTAQIGDLVESVFKREAGVKDSGRLFPGHGGVLDRFDALFFTLPVAFGYVSLIMGWSRGLV